MGACLGRRKLRLVYGGSASGMMGAVADAALASGGAATGVIPRALTDRERVHPGIDDLQFVVLPGGFGTLDECFEALTWTQLGIHRKPVGLLNVAGYYDHLLAFADNQVDSGFVAPEHRRLLAAEPDPDALLDVLAALPLPQRGKWRPSPEA